MSAPLKIIFAGTPEFGLPCLEALAKKNVIIQAIYTQPDRPAGRGRELQASPIKKWGLEHNIPVIQPPNFKSSEAVQELQNLNPDLMVVIAYGLILPKSVLDIPKYGCINVHASILPKWRGASPIQHAILNGDAETGVAIMQMDIGMDTGDYYQIAKTTIREHDNAKTLHDKLASLAIQPLLETISNIDKNLKPTKQDDSKATYAPKISKQDAAIDWSQSALDIANLIRAFNPWPLAYTNANSTRFQVIQAKAISLQHTEQPGKVLEINKDGILVSTNDNQALLINEIKLPGKKTSKIADYVNSNNKTIQVGMLLK